MSYFSRLKNVRKLYGDKIIRLGKIIIMNGKDGPRRYFNCIVIGDNGRCCVFKKYRYSVYKMEKKLGRSLKECELIHHRDTNTLNDKYSNLEVKIRGPHTRDHNTGRHLSEEGKKKLSLFNKGKILSKEHKYKLSLALRGRSLSSEHKRKLSENSPKYWLGKCRSEETKLKMRLAWVARKLRIKNDG